MIWFAWVYLVRLALVDEARIGIFLIEFHTMRCGLDRIAAPVLPRSPGWAGCSPSGRACSSPTRRVCATTSPGRSCPASSIIGKQKPKLANKPLFSPTVANLTKFCLKENGYLEIPFHFATLRFPVRQVDRDSVDGG